MFNYHYCLIKWPYLSMHWRLYSSFLLKQSKHLYNMSHSQSCFYLRLSAFYLTFTRRWMQSGETRPNDTLACRLEQPNIKPPTSILSCLESSGTMTAVSKCVDDHPRATCYYMLLPFAPPSYISGQNLLSKDKHSQGCVFVGRITHY